MALSIYALAFHIYEAIYSYNKDKLWLILVGIRAEK